MLCSHEHPKKARQARCLSTVVQTITFAIPIFQKNLRIGKCEVETEPCARQSNMHHAWHTTRQSESGNTVESERTLISRLQTFLTTCSVWGKLLRNGSVFSLKGETDSIMYHQCVPATTVPSFLQKKKNLRIRASPAVHHVSPVVQDDMPLRLSSRTPL